MSRTAASAAMLAGCLLLSTKCAFAADGTGSLAGDKQALSAVQTYVGQWRGVGQPKRGSNQGAWTEESQWSWRFDDGHAQIVGQLDKDKYYRELTLQAAAKPGQFVLVATPVAGDSADAKGPSQRFTGSRVDDALVFSADEPTDGGPARISLRLVAGGDRMVVLYEKRLGEGAYGRLAEVGSTRKGSSFAKAGLGGPECIVTGGLGTIAVEHNGKKYYVCCTGCRDLFRDDPEGVLADYRQRKAAERDEKK